MASCTPDDREAATAELRKLMRAPTLEGYAARHSKLSKSVTFNKYTLQSPPGAGGAGEQAAGPSAFALATATTTATLTTTSIAAASPASASPLELSAAGEPGQEQPQQPLPLAPAAPGKLSFRPLGSSGAVVAAQLLPRLREGECAGELVSAVRDVIQSRLVSRARLDPHPSSSRSHVEADGDSSSMIESGPFSRAVLVAKLDRRIIISLHFSSGFCHFD